MRRRSGILSLRQDKHCDGAVVFAAAGYAHNQRLRALSHCLMLPIQHIACCAVLCCGMLCCADAHQVHCTQQHIVCGNIAKVPLCIGDSALCTQADVANMCHKQLSTHTTHKRVGTAENCLGAECLSLFVSAAANYRCRVAVCVWRWRWSHHIRPKNAKSCCAAAGVLTNTHALPSTPEGHFSRTKLHCCSLGTLLMDSQDSSCSSDTCVGGTFAWVNW